MIFVFLWPLFREKDDIWNFKSKFICLNVIFSLKKHVFMKYFGQNFLICLALFTFLVNTSCINSRLPSPLFYTADKQLLGCIYFQDIFEEIDVNHDGTLTEQEFLRGKSILNLNPFFNTLYWGT